MARSSAWRIFIFSLASIVLIFCHSCKREWNNPFDDLPPDIWAPQDFSVTDVSITEKQLSWSYGEFNIEGFKLDRKKGDEEWQVGFKIFSISTRNWKDVEIIPDSSYYQYQLYAFAGTNQSIQLLQSSYGALLAPLFLDYTVTSVNSVTVHWQESNIGEDGYKVDRKMNNGNWQLSFRNLDANSASFEDNSVDLENNTYTYRIYAYYASFYSEQNELTIDIRCGKEYTFNHIAGEVAPVDKTVTYGTVETDLTGSVKCWITQNLGSDHQASFVTDTTETSAGWYWQFNRKQGYMHDGKIRTPNSTWISPISESMNWQIAQDPCALLLGSGWRIPTYNEWINVLERSGWGDWYGPWSSSLKMHAGGALDLNTEGSLIDRGTFGGFWSSTQIYELAGSSLDFNNNQCWMNTEHKAHAFTIRCLKD